MALPMSPATSWTRGIDLPSRLFETGRDDYELYEEDGEFVLSIELPGFEREDIGLSWDEGQLFVRAEHAEESSGRQRTYSRRFRFPKDVDPDEITARYENGVLTVRLPVMDGAPLRGEPIEIEG